MNLIEISDDFADIKIAAFKLSIIIIKKIIIKVNGQWSVELNNLDKMATNTNPPRLIIKGEAWPVVVWRGGWVVIEVGGLWSVNARQLSLTKDTDICQWPLKQLEPWIVGAETDFYYFIL